MGATTREKPKGSGIWWVFINHHGKRKSKKIGTDERLAKEVARKIEAKLTLQEFNMAPKEEAGPSFKVYAVNWLETLIKTTRRSGTYKRYKEVLEKYAFPAIGKTPIENVTRGNVRDLLLSVHAGGLSKSTVGLVRDVISGPIGYALDEGVIKTNPVTGVLKRLNMKRDKRAKGDTLTHEEVATFLETCQGGSLREYHPFFLCAFRTGMRLGELLALQWGDVDFHGQFIEVRRSYKLGKISPTKTGGIRRVDMSDQLTEALHNLHTQRKREAIRDGRGGVVETIFHRDGKPMEQNYIRRIFKRILKSAGLREIRLHDTRHTFASLLLTDGISPAYVKDQMGHSGIGITVDVYGHMIPSSNRDVVNRLDTHLSAPHAHPEKEKGLQHTKVTGPFQPMVPKARLELAQAYAH